MPAAFRVDTHRLTLPTQSPSCTAELDAGPSDNHVRRSIIMPEPANASAVLHTGTRNV
jgi:hypothetical protein